MRIYFSRRRILYSILCICTIIFFVVFMRLDEGYQGQGKRISFITYGNTTFAQARDRIIREAQETGIFNGIVKGYSPNDLSEEFKEATSVAVNQPRGGGYWIWKPYIIYTTLEKMNDDEFLCYSDAGSRFNISGLERFNEYIQMIEPSTGKSVVVMQLDNLKASTDTFEEKVWTTSALFEYFQIDTLNPIRNSSQILATVFICRKTPESMDIVKRWLDVAMEKPELFTDMFNEDAKNKEPMFRENRHDQSVFSLIVKQQPYKQCTVLLSDEVDETDNNKAQKLPIWATRSRL